jgi:hypothetical protein
MPWTPKQMKVIRAKAHGWNPPGSEPFEGVSKRKLKKMQREGTKRPTARDAAMALKDRRR